MKRLIAVPTEAGTDILVEVEDDHARPTMRGGGTPAPVVQATRAFEDSVAKIAPLATGAVARLRAAAEGASEVTVKFGLKFTADAGVFIASVGSEATFEVGLKWTDPAKK